MRTVEISQSSDGVFALKGDLTFNTVEQARVVGEKLIQQNESVTFDFSDIGLTDSASLALLTTWTRIAVGEKKKIFFIHLPKQLIETARVSNLLHLLSVNDSEKDI